MGEDEDASGECLFPSLPALSLLSTATLGMYAERHKHKSC